MCREAVDLSFKILKHLSTWRCKIHELLAWRKSAPTLQELQIADIDSVTISNRVIRIFHDSDVPIVLQILVCVNGLAKMFKKVKDHLTPCIKVFLNHSVQNFLEQTCKKRGMGDVDPRKIFSTIQNLKLHILEGRNVSSGLTSVQLQSDAELFDVDDPLCHLQLRKEAEELFGLCNSQQSKTRLTTYICGNPGAVTPGLNKAVKDLLRQLYLVQEVMKADEHLDKVTDFSDMSLREKEIEVTGSIYLNRASAVALQLAKAAVNSSYGGSLDPVFIAFELFDGASEKLLNTYKSQLIFLELRQTAMEGLEVVLDDICRQAVIQAKVHACTTVLNLPVSLWVEEVSGNPKRARTRYRFDSVFRKKVLCLAGYDIEIHMAFVDRVSIMVKGEYKKISRELETSRDPTLISASYTRMKIIEAARRWLSTLLELPESPTGESTELRFQTVSKECIVQKLLPEFNFNGQTKRFTSCRSDKSDLFSFKMQPRQSTPKIAFNEVRSGHRDNPSFGSEDVASLHNLLSKAELKSLLSEIQDLVLEHLTDFVEDGLYVLYDFIPPDLANLDVLGMAKEKQMSAAECLSLVMEKFGNRMAEEYIWAEPIKSLETIGNSLIFLHLLQVRLRQDQISSAIQQCSTLKDMSNIFGGSAELESFDSCNPFEMEIRRQRSRGERERKEGGPSETKVLENCVKSMKVFMSKIEGESTTRRNFKNAISLILLLKTYAATNSQLVDAELGDGVVWGAYVITQLSRHGCGFERRDWIHGILRMAHMDEVQAASQTTSDLRSFLANAQKTVSSWRQVSRIQLFQRGRSGVEGSMEMTKEPLLRGFFGQGAALGVQKHKQSTRFASRMGSTIPRGRIIKNQTYGSFRQTGSTVGEIYPSMSLNSKRGIMADDPGQRLRASLATWKLSHDEDQSNPFGHRHHSG